jgi:hypothetical protein
MMKEEYDYVTPLQMRDWLYDAVNTDDKEDSTQFRDLAKTAALIAIAEELKAMNERAERDWFAENEEAADNVKKEELSDIPYGF